MKRNVENSQAARATVDGPYSSTPRQLPQVYTVQQATTMTGLSEHTLRYYERIGLIQPVLRQESSGHRRYDAADLAKLEVLARLRATGMPIDKMRRYFELRAEGDTAAVELQALLTAQLEELQRRMAALQTHIQYVESKIDYWQTVQERDEARAKRIADDVHEPDPATLATAG